MDSDQIKNGKPPKITYLNGNIFTHVYSIKYDMSRSLPTIAYIYLWIRNVLDIRRQIRNTLGLNLALAQRPTQGLLLRLNPSQQNYGSQVLFQNLC